MCILNELQNKKQSKKIARQGLEIIKQSIKDKSYQLDKSIPTMPVFRVNNVLIATFQGKKLKFQGYFSHYYDDKIAKELECLIKGIDPKNPNQNKGHSFEETVAYVLRSLGHKVQNIKAINWMPEINEQLKDALKHIPVQKFKKLNDWDNIKSLSSDFMSKEIGISCKNNTKVLKHPQLGKVFAMLDGKDRTDFIDDITLLKDNKGEYSKEQARELLGADREVAEKIAKEVFEKINHRTHNAVKEIYDFLIGKERPIIITKKNKNIEVLETENWGKPTSYKINLKNEKIEIEFDNGVSLRHRVKSAINSKVTRELPKVYKEEWQLMGYPSHE